MASYDNIEKSAYKKGQYVGYGHGTVFSIVKNGSDWQLRGRDAPHEYFSAKTLKAASDWLRGEAPRKSNPSPRTKKSTAISGRKGLSKTAYVNRPSQATEHKAPTKRLKARRKAALSAPEGYFPNPVGPKLNKLQHAQHLVDLDNEWRYGELAGLDRYKKMTAAQIRSIEKATEAAYKFLGLERPPYDPVKARKAMRGENPLKPGIEKSGRGHYHVEYSAHKEGPWKLAGAFPSVGAARDYAKALHAKNPGIWFRVAD